MTGPCMCGSPDCPSCGGAQGTYRTPNTIEDVLAALGAVTKQLEDAISGIEGTVEPQCGWIDLYKAKSAVQWAQSILAQHELCEACELRPAAEGAYLCTQCAEAAAEAAYERYQEEAFRGGEAEAYLAEEQARIQRELKR